MIVQKALDFRRIDILSPPDDHVLGPSQYPQASLVELDDIAGGGPAVGIENRGSKLLVTVVAGRCMGAPEIEDTGFSFGNFVLAGPRP